MRLQRKSERNWTVDLLALRRSRRTNDNKSGGPSEHRFRPFEGKYAALLPAAVMALVPFIITSTAYVLFSKDPGRELGISPTGLEVISGIALAGYAFGALVGNGFDSYRFTVPLSLGMVSFVALILTQYHKKEALSPLRPMWHTYPVLGTIIAMVGGVVFMSLLELGLRFQGEVQHLDPTTVGLSFWPLFPAVVFSAGLLALLIRTRYLPLLILSGMLCLLAAGALMTRLSTNNPGTTIGVSAALLGYGAGATVSPALWPAGFSLPSKMVGRIFALVELVRSVADFVLAPVILEIARVV